MWILSTRECATIIWFIPFMIFLLLKKEARDYCWKAVTLLLGKRLRLLWEIILIYYLAVTILLCQLPIWDNAFLKDIILWVLFSGLVYGFNAVSYRFDEAYIKRTIKDSIKVTMVLEFLISTFTFDIWTELLIIPIITITIMANEVAKSNDEFKLVHRFLEFLIAIFGLCILYNTLKIAISEYKLFNINMLISFFIPIVYLLLSLPLYYALGVYSKYEMLFSRMSFYEEDIPKTRFQHRMALFGVCGFSISRIALFQREYLGRMKNETFLNIIADFRLQVSQKNRDK